ncbi:MAG: nucleotidyltransferase domain-containing protein [Oscillospiraceae bacterium]|nr:nucleotidyltransferase domain-containing protein [Oscillospiraceae bacterium]
MDLFGSYASGTNTQQSDVDLLVEFLQPQVSLLTLSALKLRMEELLGLDVDIVHGPLPESSLLEVDRRISLYGA